MASLKTNLVLAHTCESMPANRSVPSEGSLRRRRRVAIRYDACAHESCRNNPNANPPYDRDCRDHAHAMPPNGANRVLLHSCCAPCSGAMFEEMLEKNLNVTIFFYNPNIHPRKEYDIRKEENKKYALKHGVPFVDADYDAKSWYKRTKGMEFDPERGTRCTACFDMRMEVTAAYASKHGFPVFTTTNATSRWKDIDQVNASGLQAAEMYPDVQYWVYNWQTDEMTLRKYQISAENKFYKQEYCGCAYSLRDSNLYRKKHGIPLVKIGGETAGLGTRYGVYFLLRFFFHHHSNFSVSLSATLKTPKRMRRKSRKMSCANFFKMQQTTSTTKSSKEGRWLP